MRSRTLEGHWWLPDRPAEKIAGTATYDAADQPTLRLIGAFTSSEEQSAGSFRIDSRDDLPLIHGRCEGTAVTLLQCREANFVGRLTGPEDWRQTLKAQLMLVGIWLGDPDEECFDQIVIGIDHLLAWARKSGLRREHQQVAGRWTATSRHWQQPESVAAEVPEGSIELRVGCSMHGRATADRTEETLAEHANFTVTVPELHSAHALIRGWTKTLQDLLTIAVDKPCGVHDITLIRQNAPQGADSSRPARPVLVTAYLAPIYKARPDDRAVLPERVLFTLADAPFAKLLSAWLTLNKRLGPVTSMLLGQRYMGRSYTENRLITAVAAAEALHRRLRPDATYVTADEFETLTKAALDATPQEHRLWLRDRIRNEPSLKQRLMQLVESVGEDVVYPFMPRPNRWATASKDARNLLVHRFEQERGAPPDGAEMYVLSEMTSAVITLNLLQELGLPREHLINLAKRHDSFRWLASDGPQHAPRLFSS